MGDFFGSIYCWFEDFFGLNLAEYMWGTTTESGENLFIGIGLWMIIISALVMALYYYIIDNPHWADWKGWGVLLLINMLIQFIVGWQWTMTDLNAGKMVTVDPQTNQTEALDIDASNCVCFGVSNMILSILVFVILSYAFRWWSKNSSHSPF